MVQQRNNNQLQPHWKVVFRLFSGLQYFFKLGSLVFVAGGAFLFLYGSFNLYKAYQSTSWPSVQGVITVSRMGVDTSTSTTTGTNYRRTTTTSYSAEIAYDYKIDNVSYSNNEVIAGGQISTSSTSWARRTLNKYPESSVVRVFYNPLDPYQSVLETGIHPQSLLMPGLGIGLVVIGFFLYRFLGLFFGFFQYINKAVQQDGQNNPAPPQQQQQQRYGSRSNVRESNVVGSWRIINQIPSYQDLAISTMKHWGASESDAANTMVIKPGEAIVEITKSRIKFKVKGVSSLMSFPPSKYTKEGDKLVLGSVKSGLLGKAFTSFFPSYFQYAFDGSQLILTTDEIKGYDNQRITYFLERV